MKYLLLSNYEHPKFLSNYINSESKVAVLTFSNHKYILDRENYDSLWNRKKGREFKDVYDQYSKFGVLADNITVLDSIDTDTNIIRHIAKSDVLFLSGGNPVEFMEVANRNGGLIAKALQSKTNGIIIGSSAGAMVMCNKFFLYPYPYERMTDFEYIDGLGLMEDFNSLIIVHYDDNNEYMKDAVECCHTNIIALRDNEYIFFM